MKILFGVQGTGNGHISRAREVLPLLQRYGEVDLLISGTQADVHPGGSPRFSRHGFSFIFGKKGGVDTWKTWRTMNLRQLRRDVKSLPVHDYDLVVNDFEPVSAWACRVQGKESVALSHQCAFLSTNTPRPSRWNYAELIFKHYAPATHHIGFHFERYDDFIHTPVIRSEIRRLESVNRGHVTVYLPAYHDQLLTRCFEQLPDVRWEVFSKHSKAFFTHKNISVFPVQNELYNTSMAGSAAVITGGGFEGPAEAFFMGKKLMVIPMSGQYEQQCNALSAGKAGAKVVRRIDRDFVTELNTWLENTPAVRVNYPDETEAIVDAMIKKYR
ncbi:MAG: glycosyl transferase [Mucilaginibacter polytrichastri]|nr:glycosyl transferase [Mucilaginibacter polytrichastri]